MGVTGHEKQFQDITLEQLVDKSYEAAKEGGWHEKEIPFPEACALLHSEVSEALEEYRKGTPAIYRGPDGKPEGMAIEFADILIRMGHYAKIFNLNLTEAVHTKMAYNKTRPHRHGGKLC